MIRMVEMSVLLGIKSHGWKSGTKKGRACRASLQPQRVLLARGWSLDQIPQPRKGFRGPINRHFGPLNPWSGWGDWLAEPKLRSPAFAGASSEGWRPGLDLNQDKERCTALAWMLSATGPAGSSPIRLKRATACAG